MQLKRLFFRQRRRRLLITLLIFLIIMAGYGIYNAIRMKADGVEEHYTHRGEIKQYALRDGSQLKLDTESRAVVAYDNSSRVVKLLSGRARFAVSENNEEQRPFRVSANGVRVESGNGNFVVDIADNKVSVCPLDKTVTTFFNGKTETVGPGQRLEILPEGRAKVFQRKYTDIDWLSGSLVLNKIPLSEAIEMINSYRAVPVVLLDNDKQNIVVDRVLDLSRLDEEVEEMMLSLGLTRESLPGSEAYR
ncbi:TPA: FecR domain-containing protein [Morganella morganii subsp. sibonii]|nr:hypothetical protein [Morganella morganii]MBS9541546.1 FecR domain-containing protein [Morganella morganii subsp. morganii]HAE77776.1 hypothetical protein [Morganella sp. (in: enterobacteria)]HDU8309145.1 FecR domain-containing protein [Morganella morganii subsp. sibonii]EGT3630029.1 hypothetical protein [Morganella morganii]